MKHYIYLLFTVFSLLISCNDENTSKIKKEIVAGNTEDENMIVTEYETPKTLQEIRTGCEIFTDNLTIDLNGDYQGDLIFKYRFSNGYCEDTSLDEGFYVKKDIEIVNRNLQIATNEANWVLMLNPGDTINDRLDFSGESEMIVYHGESPQDVGIGYWYWNLEGVKYVGFRLNGKYGWIKLDPNTQNFEILGYAMLK